MGLEWRLAWRNVWRNPRRSGLTVAATVFAVVLVVFFVAFAAGVHEKMIEDSVRLHSGHVAVSGKGYRENQTLEEFVRLTPAVREVFETTEGVRGWAPRILGFALVSRDVAATGTALLGVDPAREATVTTLAERVSRGRFVSPGAGRTIVLGERLAEHLGAGLGDELLLYSQAYTLEPAYDLFRVVGLLDLPDAALERSLAVISLADAREFFVYGDRVSEVAVLARDADAAPDVARRLEARLVPVADPPVEVWTWDRIQPELHQLILLDDAGMYVLLAILVVVVGFGILNTVLMAVLERRRELGVCLALGLRPAALFRLVYLESLFMAAVGLVIGLAVGIPLVLWLEGHPVPLRGQAAQAMELFGAEPVYTWKLKRGNPIGSTVTVIVVASLASLYPAWKAARSRPVDALRGL